jgi:hemolysin activation/secretion protein
MTRKFAFVAVLAALLMVSPGRAEDAGNSERVAFDILEYQIEGNTVLPALAIEKAVYPHLGPQKTIADVEQARAALEKAYQTAGYLTVLVEIPEQKVGNGIVHLKVTEGSIERLRITGNRYYSRGYIRSRVPSLAAGTVPDFPQVQKELSGVSRGDQRRVTPVLRPGTTPGKVEVELKVEDAAPLHGEVEANNRQTPNTEPLRLQAWLRYDNLWQRDHSVSLLVQTSPEDTQQVQVYSGTYVMPLGDSRNVLALYAVDSKSDVAAVGDISVIGAGRIYGARAILPLTARQRYFHSITFGIDHKDFDDSVVLQGADSVDTPIDYTPLLAQYSATWAGTESSTEGSIGVNFAPRGQLFGNDDQEFGERRLGAQANYAYLRAELKHQRPLGARFRLHARMQGQLASQPLISNEQFAAGGADSVRGYLEAEAFGDDGIQASLELHTSPLISIEGTPIQEFFALGFVDGARLYVQEAVGQPPHASLASAGLGLRLKAWSHLDAALDVGVPFESAQETRAGEPRVHLRVAYGF